MLDFLLVLGCSIFALMGHGARKKKWLEWVVRFVIGAFFIFEIQAALLSNDGSWPVRVLFAMGVATGLILLFPIRKFLSLFLDAADGITSLRVITGPVRHKLSPLVSLMDKQVFRPESIPHMVGLFVYITTLGYFLQVINPASLEFPAMPLPIPISILQLFSYNGIGLIIVSLCGVGIFVTRNWKEAFQRLGWVRPSATHVGIGLALIAFSFGYDLIWALYTHGLAEQDLASKLSQYNSGTFSVGGEFGMSVIVALATAVFAGVGEETLIRGALQPALGILPAAILHGILHAQFAHAPIFIIQVAIWSIFMGIVKRCTNTTTTIIGHAGFNFVTTFLFSFNP